MVSGPFAGELGSPVDNHLVVSVPFSRVHGLSGGNNLPDARDLEVFNIAVIINDAAGFTIFDDAFTKIGINADYDVTSLDLPGFTPPSSVSGRYEKRIRQKISFLGFGDGNFPPHLSISSSGLEASRSVGDKSAVTVAVSDTADADAVCFTTIEDHFNGAMASDLVG